MYPAVAGDLGYEIQQYRPVLGRLQLRGVEDEEEGEEGGDEDHGVV